MFGKLRKDLGEILGKVCKMEGVAILKAATLPKICTYVCINSTEAKYVKNNRPNKRKECINDI